MLKNKSIAVVVPAYNEELLIGKVIDTMPEFVDHIVIVDDLSTDKTLSVVENLASSNSKITVLRHKTNKGVGATIATGYIWARDNSIDVTVDGC